MTEARIPFGELIDEAKLQAPGAAESAGAGADYARERADQCLAAYTNALINAQVERTPEAWIAVGVAFDTMVDAYLLTDDLDRCSPAAQRAVARAVAGSCVDNPPLCSKPKAAF